MKSRVLILCFVAASVSAQAPPSFREGVIAFEKKEWAKAEQLMRDAVAGNPNETEGTVSIAGQWFETYVPHFFLARALAKQGKCAEAVKEFEESERQGVTLKIGDFAKHVRNRGGCKPQAKPEKPSRTVGEVTVPFGEGEIVVPPSEPKGAVPIPQPPKEPSPARADRARLTAAVQAYLAGRYVEATRLIDVTQFRDRTARAEASLFRAAASYARYRAGGEKDDALMRTIERDLRTYRALRPDGRPDPRVFPPGFIALAR